MWGSMCRGLWLQCQWQVRQACHTRQRGCRGADLTHLSTSVVLIEHTVSLSGCRGADLTHLSTSVVLIESHHYPKIPRSVIACRIYQRTSVAIQRAIAYNVMEYRYVGLHVPRPLAAMPVAG